MINKEIKIKRQYKKYQVEYNCDGTWKTIKPWIIQEDIDTSENNESN